MYTMHPFVIMQYLKRDHIMKYFNKKLNNIMKCSHDGLIYSYVLLLLHLSCWYYLTVRLPKWNLVFFEFEEICGGFLENLHVLRKLEDI